MCAIYFWDRYIAEMRTLLTMLIVIGYRAIMPCKVDICMVWTLENNQLNLKCRVNYLKLTIVIENPMGDEEAHCSPPTPIALCETHRKVGKIFQNLKTNETTLILPDAKRINYNGKWTCRHGLSNDHASIKITTLTTDNNDTVTDKGESCLTQFLSWTMIGFMASFLAIRIMMFGINCVSERKVERLTERVYKLCWCFKILDARSELICKRIAYLIVTAYFFGMPLFIGFVENKTCTAPAGFIAVGVIIGILVNATTCSNVKRHVDDSENIAVEESML